MSDIKILYDNVDIFSGIGPVPLVSISTENKSSINLVLISLGIPLLLLPFILSIDWLIFLLYFYLPDLSNLSYFKREEA
jgi:hypothetical protein